MINQPRYPHSPYHLPPIEALTIATHGRHGDAADLALIKATHSTVQYAYGTNCRVIIRTDTPHALPAYRLGYIRATKTARPHLYLSAELDSPESLDALGGNVTVVAVQPRTAGTPYYAVTDTGLGRCVTSARIINTQRLPDWY